MATPDNQQRKPDRADIPGLAVRLAALNLLDGIFRRGESLDRIATRQTKKLSPPDAAFALAIVGEVLRWLAPIDALIDSVTESPLPDDAKARMVLRLSLAQLLRLDTPPHAVISTALPLLEGGPKRLTHALLSRLVREGAALPERPSLPPEVAARWREAWRDEAVTSAEDALAAPPPPDLSFSTAEAAANWTGAHGGESFAPAHVRIARGQAIETLPEFDGGQYWVQDIAASIPARLLGAGAGRSALDLCAAPGGKTMQLAAAGWHVAAVDISGARLNLLGANLERTGLSADVVQADLLKWSPDAPVDAILLDAPCSATGIFRRHPDVLVRAGERQIAEMAELQATLLDRAADWLKPGGKLVYATCSLEPAEGELQADAFLERHSDFAIEAVRADELPGGIAPTTVGHVRTGPWCLAEQGRCDGFFAARFVRAAT